MTLKSKSAVKKHTQPQVIRAIAPLRAWVSRVRGKGETVALVPTMGALHKGHLALVRLARRRADRVVVSIFVNPAQFAPNEDFSNYPRTWDADIAALSQLSVDAIWAPGIATMYPDGFATRIVPGGPALAGLEDKFRPHFFGGVCTVVAKLLLQVAPDFATFGEKDYQQLKVVTAMARDLDIPTKIVGLRTVREKDGLAMSSRNAYLSANERAVAPTLYRVLTECAARLKAGSRSPRRWPKAKRRSSARALPSTISKRATPRRWPRSPRLPTARCGCWWPQRLGRTRLIDNIGV